MNEWINKFLSVDWYLDSRFEISICQFWWIDLIRDSQSEIIFNSPIEINLDSEYRNYITGAQFGDSNLNSRIEFQLATVNTGMSVTEDVGAWDVGFQAWKGSNIYRPARIL